MPTTPTAANARLGSTNLPVEKKNAWIVRLENIKTNMGCRIVYHAFLARTKTERDRQNAQHVATDNTRT